MKYNSKCVICPFYIGDDKKSIKCEGEICPSVINIFTSTEKKQAYLRQYCDDEYQNCKHAKKIVKKYN